MFLEFQKVARILAALLLSGCAFASQDSVKRATSYYQRTDYRGSLQILAQDPAPDAATYHLMGKNHFMLTDYKKASEYFEKAAALDPGNSEYMLWLGRAYGRRAETSSWMTAGMNASKARQCFEKAVALDPHNNEAMNDLFDYYLNAPGFLGGGADKAEAIARRIAEDRPAEGHYAEAQLADRKKEYSVAEDQLRRAMEMAPHEVGRAIDLARYLAKHGHVKESDAVYSRAEKIAPNEPRVAFERAKSYIENRRNLDQARKLLRQYLESDITPDDPPKQAAEELLRRTMGG
jgi:Flp pilus assembly protein TadD